MVWGVSAFIFMFVFCLFLSLYTACFSGQEVEDEWTPGLTRCVWKSICVCTIVCERDTSNWIDECTGHALQGPVTILSSNPGVLSCTCTWSLSQAQYPVPRKPFWWCCRSPCCSSCCRWCCCCGWDLYQKTTEQPPQNICDWSSHPAIIICHLIRLVKIKNTLLSELSNMENSVGR